MTSRRKRPYIKNPARELCGWSTGEQLSPRCRSRRGQSQESFYAAVDEAIRDEVIPDRMYLKSVFKKLGESATISAAADGSLWMNFADEEAPLSRDAAPIRNTPHVCTVAPIAH